MVANPGPYSLDALSDEDTMHLTAGAPPPVAPATPPAPVQPVQAAPPTQGPISLDRLTDDQARALTAQAPSAAPQDVGYLESFGRGALEGATFGFDDELGLQDKARREAAKKANPWTHFMGEMAGTVVPMVGAAPLAAAKGAGLLARGTRAAGSLLAPGDMSTVARAATQGVKLGATYGALSGAGHTDTTDNRPDESALWERARHALVGAGMGAVLGGPLGAAGYGASRLLGAAINRLSPEMKGVLEAAQNPETQGVRDVMRQLGYDNYTMQDLQAVRVALKDPAQAHRYADLNLVEALETRPITPHGNAGELRPEVVTSPNLRDMAQDFANTNGRGRQEAVEAFATRRNEMAGRINEDVDRLFGQSPASRAADVDNLTGSIDTVFGSGNAAEAAAAQAAQKGALGRRYDKIRDQPLVLSEDLGQSVQNLPSFQRALQYAAENDVIRNPGADFRSLWSRNELGQTSLTLSPNNILDIHHALVLAAKPPIGGHTSESVMAGNLKGWFSQWADKQLKGHKDLRADYARFKTMLEAQDHAAKLSLNRGDDAALQFFNTAVGRRDTAGRALQQTVDRYDAAMQRFQSGQIKSMPQATNLKKQVAAVEAENEIVEAFRRTWGEQIKQELRQSGDPNGIVRGALTPEGQRRLTAVLGPERSREFLNAVMVMEGRNQGLALGLNAGGSDHAALRFLDRAAREGRTEVVEAFRNAWGDRIRQDLAQATSPAQVNAVVNRLLSQEGKNRILRILGPDQGREFIEILYNKKQQAGLSQTLFGNSDTAYKLARNKKMDALMDVVHGLAPWSFRPGQVWSGIREIGSSAYKQRRADQGNLLLSQQGPEKVGDILDSIVARNQLQTSGHPYIMNPTARAIGPATNVSVGDILEQYSAPAKRRP